MLYRKILRPILFRLPPAPVHETALHALRFALSADWARRIAIKHLTRAPFGEIKRFGLSFTNPIGLAAGFDKNGIAAQALSALGFGFIEVGTVTHQAQPGNPHPRLFRLPLDQALINRAGFNNDGAAAVFKNLRAGRPNCVLGINIGKTRAVAIDDAVADYLACFETIHSLADYVAINVSSPNTPNLRELQRADALYLLLSALQTLNSELTDRGARSAPVPLLVKIAPDLNRSELEAIVDVARQTKLAGIIATNTTTSRANLRTPARVVKSCGAGGLSGAPLRARATETIAQLYQLTNGTLPIIGVGGIFTARDAWEKICAGACLVQLYTGFIYEGLRVARNINDGLTEIARQHNLHSLDEAIGSRAAEFAAA
jgi:dihydroorotate dehydrogenase